MHCHRHPERRARRRCFRCHQLLCTSCQIRAFHHLFCSRYCILLYGLQKAHQHILSSFCSLLAVPPLRILAPRRGVAALAFLILCALIVLSSQQAPFSPRRGGSFSVGEARYLASSLDGASSLAGFPSDSTGTASAYSPPSSAPRPSISMKQTHSFPPLPPWRKASRFPIEEKEGAGEGEEVPDISRGDLAKKEIALTFDGGGGDNAASEILRTLREREIACTFFLSGEFIRSYPDLVRQIVEDGHEVANHTETHPHLTSYGANSRQDLLPGVNRRFLWRELMGAEELFLELTGRRMAPFWRAPYGEQNATLRRWAKEIGYQHVSWTSDGRAKKSLDTLDWVADPSQKMYCSSQDVRDRILEYGEGANGGIILMHLSTSRRQDRVHERLGEIIEGLQERGYRLVKVSELVSGARREMKEGGD
ncbi:MAG: polysaccharide deacetylase family protein [candidate division NC10 bacterium]|nr:polysaccharide deacetylase family protein [candidate division NC10 bacterium]